MTIFFLSYLSSDGQNLTFIDQREDSLILKNKVKSVSCYDYEYNDSLLKGKRYKTYYEEYDIKGNQIKSIDYWEDGHVSTQSTCITNKQGFLSRCKEKQFDIHSQEEYSSDVFYDAVGKPIKIIRYKQQMPERKEVYTYNDDGHPIKMVYLSMTDTPEYIETYKYNNNGLLIEDLGITSEIDSEDHRIYYTDRKYVYSYDQNGNEIERLEYSGSQQQFSTKEIYDYNRQGNLIEKKNYDKKDSLKTKGVLVYDSNNNPIDWIESDSTGKIRERIVSAFNDKRLVTRKTFYDTDGLHVAIYEYVYF